MIESRSVTWSKPRQWPSSWAYTCQYEAPAVLTKIWQELYA
jgi:hypothetical protein